MSSTAVNCSTPVHGGGVLAFIHRASGRMVEAAARRRTLRELRNLDCATLRDIGMSRSEIISVVYGDPEGRRRTHV